MKKPITLDSLVKDYANDLDRGILLRFLGKQLGWTYLKDGGCYCNQVYFGNYELNVGNFVNFYWVENCYFKYSVVIPPIIDINETFHISETSTMTVADLIKFLKGLLRKMNAGIKKLAEKEKKEKLIKIKQSSEEFEV